MNVSNQERGIASIACGIGVALMTSGALSLAIPWVNMALAKHHEQPSQTTRSGN